VRGAFLSRYPPLLFLEQISTANFCITLLGVRRVETDTSVFAPANPDDQKPVMQSACCARFPKQSVVRDRTNPISNQRKARISRRTARACLKPDEARELLHLQ
jgi:hypothetical protein